MVRISIKKRENTWFSLFSFFVYYLLYFSDPIVPNRTHSIVKNEKFYTYVAGSNATFKCSGNVGGPFGWFWWFLVRDDVEANITNYAVDDKMIKDVQCTYKRNGILTLPVTIQMNDSIVRCKVYNPYVPAPLPGCLRLCSEFPVMYIVGEL